jgi:transposase InsO family protein
MIEWELDFGMISLGSEQWLEFCAIIDSGTSIWIDTHPASGFNAEQALQVLAQTLLAHGLPQRLRFDRDTRFVGSWTTDGYPSAWVRFLRCVGVEPVVCPPHRPDRKPFVERLIGTIKHEKLYLQRPGSVEDACDLLNSFREFYNHERPHQGLSCNNQPPLTALPILPPLPSVPEVIDPDAWLQA